MSSFFDTLSFSVESFYFRPEIPSWVIAALLIPFVVALVYVAWVDARTRIIPNKVTGPGIVLSIIFSYVLYVDWTVHFVVGFSALIVFSILAFCKRKGRYILGMGDAKLYTLLAFVFGLALIPCLLISSLSGLIAMLFLQTKKFEQRRAIPFGPHIVLSALVIIIWAIIV